MAAILENDDHIKILRGPRYFTKGWPIYSVCAKSVADIIIWTVLLKYAIMRSTNCEGITPVAGGKGAIQQGFDVFFVISLNKLLNNQWSCRWAEPP